MAGSPRSQEIQVCGNAILGHSPESLAESAEFRKTHTTGASGRLFVYTGEHTTEGLHLHMHTYFFRSLSRSGRC